MGIHATKIRSLNSPILWISLVLAAIGLINLYSATFFPGKGDVSSIFYSQVIWMMVALSVCIIAWLIDMRFLKMLSYPLYIATLLALIAVLIWGEEISGHQSWLRIGSWQFQPSEFAKLGFLLAFSSYLADHETKGGFGFKQLMMPLLMVGFPIALVVIEGDLGNALFFILIFASMTFFVGIRLKTFTIFGSLGLISLPLAYFFLLNPYQRSRIQTFVNPDLDPKGHGYQIIQSKIAVGSGMLSGKGFLHGMQNKLMYLPERHTDFIFPVLAEEWGFIGSVLVILLYFGLIVTGLHIASRAGDRFSLFMSLGISILLFWQVVINLGGVLGLLPLTGVTLPFLSYGGSSLVTVLFGIGLLLNVQSQS